jgi:hypothetical protein
MKNTLLYKVTAVAIGSLLSFSGAAFAATNIGNVGNSAILVSQLSPLNSSPVFSKSVAVAETALGNALAASNSLAIGGKGKSALSLSIAKATSLLGNASALSGSTAIGDRKAVAISLAQAETVLGDALAIANSNAVSGPGKPAIAKSLASAKTAVGNATAVATSVAR